MGGQGRPHGAAPTPARAPWGSPALAAHCRLWGRGRPPWGGTARMQPARIRGRHSKWPQTGRLKATEACSLTVWGPRAPHPGGAGLCSLQGPSLGPSGFWRLLTTPALPASGTRHAHLRLSSQGLPLIPPMCVHVSLFFRGPQSCGSGAHPDSLTRVRSHGQRHSKQGSLCPHRGWGWDLSLGDPAAVWPRLGPGLPGRWVRRRRWEADASTTQRT